MSQKTFLFEVSWEVCNLVGGIHTVLETKMEKAVENYGDNYCLIGPYLGENNPEFLHETFDDPNWQKALATLDQAGIEYVAGVWNIPQRPKVLLLKNFMGRYDLNALLHTYWKNFKVNSINGHYDYQEPVTFATVAAELISHINKSLLKPQGIQAIAHFHEWMMGAGVLYLHDHAADIATVFTTHATVLGRALCSRGDNIYKLDPNFNADRAAIECGVEAKHTMERAAAKYADCFTTVSHITAQECEIMLGASPSFVVHNGINSATLKTLSQQAPKQEIRHKLISLAEQVKQRHFNYDDVKLVITSGRSEFVNKGYDVFLETILGLAKYRESTRPVIVYCLLAGQHHNTQTSRFNEVTRSQMHQAGVADLLLHGLNHYDNDPFVQFYRLHREELERNNVFLIYSDAYLNGQDGVIDFPYYQVMSSFDMGVFPSYYEPWGYTPHEALALGVPTVTTDSAGFGDWINKELADQSMTQDVVAVVPRKERRREKALELLANGIITIAKKIGQPRADKCYAIAELSDWNNFFKNYANAYEFAVEVSRYHSKQGAKSGEEIQIIEKTAPQFRRFNYVPQLPQQIAGLHDLAANIWWSWQSDACELFETINPELWKQCGENPVVMLRLVSQNRLNQLALNTAFVEKYRLVMQRFNGLEEGIKETDLISNQKPIAYFCLEYGLHQSLPLYAGGLGILAGDHLKTASDMKMPLIAIGLFYHKGYFSQKITRGGEQVANFDEYRPDNLPMTKILNEHGQPMTVVIDLPDRHLYACVWLVKVGNIKLYLLDTNVNENNAEDKLITAKLYDGDRNTRFLQEMVLAMGGVRLVYDGLKLDPAVFHMNEGHSSLLIIERIRYMMQRGYNFEQAARLVKASNVFTTHTPVPAGNEMFEFSIVDHYLKDYIRSIGMSYGQFIRESKQDNGHGHFVFSMTMLAMRYASKINAVARLHKEVAELMWHQIWPSLLREDLPIGYVTNGTHVPTWTGKEMLAEVYKNDVLDTEAPLALSDDKLWSIKQTQKRRLLNFVKEKVQDQYSARGESAEFIHQTISNLTEDALVVGFARRLATYKRHALLFQSPERLAKLLTNPQKPVVFLIAGKAHPSDGEGQAQICYILELARDPKFKGHVIFIEDYNMKLGAQLVQGVDIWLNNPVVPNEACGTSGMKASFNGSMNLSTLDGWWAEAYEETIGWKIQSYPDYSPEQRNMSECLKALNKLEYDIVPTYFDRDERGLPTQWLKISRRAAATVLRDFNTQRMLQEYYDDYYSEAAAYADSIINAPQALTHLTSWLKDIEERFKTCKAQRLVVEGVNAEGKAYDNALKVSLYVFPSQMQADEITAEIILNRSGMGADKMIAQQMLKLDQAQSSQTLLKFTGELNLERGGAYSYGIRLYPTHEYLAFPLETGICKWI